MASRNDERGILQTKNQFGMMSIESAITATPCASDQARPRLVTAARITNAHVVMAGSLILLLPNILFALHLALVPAGVMMLGAVASIAILTQRQTPSRETMLASPLAVPRLAVCLCLSLALLVMGGETHVMFANYDWLWRDSVLADLAHTSFPPTYQVAGQTLFLRAPLGMYMLPALAAKAGDLGIGHVVLLLQNTILLTLVLYMLATIAGRRAVLVVLVFLSFSGLDVVGELVMWLVRGGNLAAFTLPSHIENWAGLQYSSIITQLFWVPNHALPAYWLALLVLLCARGELALGTLVVVLAASLFWSPFAFVGTLPLAGYLFVRDARTILARPDFWLALMGAACFLPVALYMVIDAEQVPHDFILFHGAMVFLILLFLLIEIPHLAIIRKVWAQLDASLKGVLAVSIVMLLALPTLHVGSSGDLLMRGSIPALFILSFSFAQALAIAWTTNRLAIFGAGMAIVSIGAVTPGQEIARSFTFPAFPISDCNIVTVWKSLLGDHPTVENYLARRSRLPSWLIDDTPTERLTNQRADCWPGLPYPPRSNISALSNAMLLQAARTKGADK